MKRWAVVAVLILLVGGAITADQLSPASMRRPKPVAPVSPGGVWGCPFVYAGNGKAWVHIANASTEASKVTVGFVRSGAPTLYQTLRLAGGSAQTVPFPATERRASGAVVQFAGGEVYASRTSVFNAGQGRRGGIGAPCQRAGERALVVPAGTTLQADTSVVLLNPSSSDAVVQMTLISAGLQTHPEGLKNIVVSSFSRRTFRLGDYAFDAKSVSAYISVRSGAITADGVISSERGVTVSPAVPTARRLVALGETHSGVMLLDAVAPGDEDALVDASIQTPDGQSALAALATGIGADTPVTQQLPPSHHQAVGLSITVREGAPIAAAARWVIQDDRGRADVAASMAVPPSRRCVAVIGAPASAARTRILLLNPGAEPATVRITLLEPAGPSQPGTLSAVVVDAGRTVALPIGRLNGVAGVVAESPVPIGMAVVSSAVGPELASIARLVAFAITGLPVPQRIEVAVEPDPHLGVPAP